MITRLAKYFRLSLNKGLDQVPLRDELELASIYLELQQVRFSEQFSFTIQADEDVLDYDIPKLTLQPIVENAVLQAVNKYGQK